MAIDLAKSNTGKVCFIITQGVWKPTEDEPRIIPGDKMVIGDNVLESLKSLSCNLWRESPESGGLGRLLSSGKSPKVPDDEMVIGDNVYESMSSFPRKLMQESLESGGLSRSLFTPPEVKRPWEEAYYPPREKVGGFYRYELPAPPNMGTGKSGGTLGMQGGLMILMFAVCYMLYMILKKRVCSFSIGWKDTDAGELELGGPRDT